jgi:hypothetical protein
MEDSLLSVASLHALAYCERLFYLEEVERLKLADAAVYAGRDPYQVSFLVTFTSLVSGSDRTCLYSGQSIASWVRKLTSRASHCRGLFGNPPWEPVPADGSPL